MPAKFDKCVAQGGKIRTVNVSKTKYMPVCIRPTGTGPRGGKTVSGHVHTKQAPKK